MKRVEFEQQKLSSGEEPFIMHPTVDFCFKELMQNAKVRKGFLAAVLHVRPEQISRWIYRCGETAVPEKWKPPAQ